MVTLRPTFCLSHKPKWDFRVRPDHICLLVLKDPSVKCHASHEASSQSTSDTADKDKHMQYVIIRVYASALCLKGDFGQILYLLISAVLFLWNTQEQNLSETSKTLLCASDIIIYLCQTPWYDNGLW